MLQNAKSSRFLHACEQKVVGSKPSTTGDSLEKKIKQETSDNYDEGCSVL